MYVCVFVCIYIYGIYIYIYVCVCVCVCVCGMYKCIGQYHKFTMNVYEDESTKHLPTPTTN